MYRTQPRVQKKPPAPSAQGSGVHWSKTYRKSNFQFLSFLFQSNSPKASGRSIKRYHSAFMPLFMSTDINIRSRNTGADTVVCSNMKTYHVPNNSPFPLCCSVLGQDDVKFLPNSEVLCSVSWLCNPSPLWSGGSEESLHQGSIAHCKRKKKKRSDFTVFI